MVVVVVVDGVVVLVVTVVPVAPCLSVVVDMVRTLLLILLEAGRGWILAS